jgi:predicted transcriptional regulator
MDNGWIKLHRQLLKWEWYKKPDVVLLYLHLMLIANNREGKFQGVTIKRGQTLTGLKALNQATGLSIQTIRTCLERLKSTGEITSKSTNKFRIITLVNYDSYQNRGKNQQANQQAHQQTTNKQLTTNKKVKKVKKVISKSKDLPKKTIKYNPLGSQVIKAFEVINPSCSRFYGNTTQRKACDELLKAHGLKNVMTVVEKILPKTNLKPRYEFPYIDTPHQLFTNWGKLATAFRSKKELSETKHKVAFQ